MSSRKFARFPLVNFYLRQHFFILSIIFICIACEAVFSAIIPFSFKFIIDALLERNRLRLIYIISGLSMGGILIVFIALCRDYLYTQIIGKIINDIRSRCFDHLSLLPMEFYARYKTGDIMARFSGNLDDIENGLSGITSGAIFPVLALISNFLFLSLLNLKLTLIAMIICPAAFIAPHKLAARVIAENYQRKTEEGRLLSVVQENILMQPVIKVFNLISYLKSNFARYNAHLMRRIARINFLISLVSRWAELTPILLQILALAIASYLVYVNRISVSSLVAFQMIFTTLIYALMRITYSLPGFIQGATGLRRIKEFLNERTSQEEPFKSDQFISFNKSIQLNQVNFSFAKERPTLIDINLTIPKGSFVAFVGPSGSGKSTLLYLIMRLYDPDSGMISIDGVDIRTISNVRLRSLMGCTLQEPMLFDDSIHENIKLGKLDATDTEIEKAAKMAKIHDAIVDMPEGYATRVGERGTMLSGGQKQRIAIARALIRSPEILLLDEVTSALDPHTEEAINLVILQLRNRCTIISVSHHLSSVINADRIYVFQEGRLVEQGTHPELLKQQRHYKKLWDKQNGFTINEAFSNATVSADRLKAIPLFNYLPNNLLEEIVHLFKTEVFQSAQMVIRQGDIGEAFYIIVRGRVGVYKEADGETKEIAMLEDGDHFGEIALLKAVPRNATVKTLTTCLFLVLSHENFRDLLTKVSGLQEKLEEIVLRSRIL